MALRWFIRSVSTKTVEQPRNCKVDKGLQTKLVKDIMMTGVREVDGVKVNNNEKMCCMNGRVNRGAEECNGFQMPLHYPRYKEEDYRRREELKVDVLLKEYGLACDGSLEEKRAYAIRAFFWPDQL